MSNVALQAAGIVVDHFGRVLLQAAENDTAVTPPAVSLRAGQLPTDTLAAAVREMTGLIVLPLRLTGLFFDSDPAGDRLTLALRCLIRGGTVEGEEGEPRAGFFPANALPPQMTPADRHLVDTAIHHSGGPPVWQTTPRTLGTRLRRTLGLPAEMAPAGEWVLHVTAVLPAADGTVACVRPERDGPWTLPGGAVARGESPWEAASRVAGAAFGGPVQLATLPAIFQAVDRPQLTFVFRVAREAGPPPGDHVSWLAPDNRDAALSPLDRQQALEALQPGPATAFHLGSPD